MIQNWVVDALVYKIDQVTYSFKWRSDSFAITPKVLTMSRNFSLQDSNQARFDFTPHLLIVPSLTPCTESFVIATLASPLVMAGTLGFSLRHHSKSVKAVVCVCPLRSCDTISTSIHLKTAGCHMQCDIWS